MDSLDGVGVVVVLSQAEAAWAPVVLALSLEAPLPVVPRSAGQEAELVPVVEAQVFELEGEEEGEAVCRPLLGAWVSVAEAPRFAELGEEDDEAEVVVAVAFSLLGVQCTVREGA